MSKHDPLLRIRHMRDYALKAVSFTKDKTQEDLGRDEILRLALTRLFELVGEAAGKVPRDVQEKHPQIPWPKIISIRNRLIHNYEDINYAILWNAVKYNLPELIDEINKIIPTEKE